MSDALMRWVVPILLLACGARTDLNVDDEPIDTFGPEVCNFEDDDWDGAIDEGEQMCGVGECTKTVNICDECTPFDPDREVCDGLDNDCDGSVDEHLEPTLISGPITIFAGPFSNGLELVETPDGLLAAIAAKSIGSPPNNVTVTARIDFDGLPTHDPILFDDLQPTQGPTLTASADGLFHMTICSPRGSENRLSSQLLDANGERVGGLIRRDPVRSCGADESFSIWTGEVHITAWVENSSAPTFETEMLVDVSNADARSLRSQILLDDTGDLSAQPYFARVGDRIVMVAGRTDPPDFTQLLQTFVFDLRGNVVAGPTILDTPAEFSPKHPRLVARRDDTALLIVANRFSQGILMGVLDANGQPRGELRWMDVPPGRYDFPAIAGRNDEVVYAASLSSDELSEKGSIFGFDPDGNVRWNYVHLVPDEPGYFGWPAVVLRAGRIYVLYTTPLTEELFEERLIVLGCEP